jgi:hypothetical protein
VRNYRQCMQTKAEERYNSAVEWWLLIVARKVTLIFENILHMSQSGPSCPDRFAAVAPSQ